MRIAQVVPYYPPHVGGMETCAKEISDRLAQRGHEVQVFTSDIAPRQLEDSSTVNPVVYRLRSWEFAHTPIVFSLLGGLLKISRDAVIHVHVSPAITPETVYLASRIRHIPYVAYVHADAEPAGRLGFLLPFYKKVLLRLVLKSASKIMVPTHDYAEIINTKYAIPKCNIVVIPCGVDVGRFRRASESLHDPVRLLFVGRLSGEKNVSLLLEVVERIASTNLRVSLSIVGDGEETDHIRAEIARRGVGSEVQLIGALTGPSLYRIYSESDIFVFPSLNESFGVVLVEAMASGLPIIASNIPGVRNLIHDNYNGLLVTPTVGGFVGAIEQLLTNPELRGKLVANGFKDVRQYDWDDIVSEFEVVYEEALRDNK